METCLHIQSAIHSLQLGLSKFEDDFFIYKSYYKVINYLISYFLLKMTKDRWSSKSDASELHNAIDINIKKKPFTHPYQTFKDLFSY
jgi:hypothetical protein